MYYPIVKEDELKELETLKSTIFNGKEKDFVVFFNSRNIRRKQIPDTMLAFKIFLEPVFFDDDLRGQFRILGNVANKKKMVFVQQLENIVRKYSGCGFNPVGSVSIYDRTIDVEKMKKIIDLVLETIG